MKNKLKNDKIGLLFNEGRGEERVEGMLLTEEILKCLVLKLVLIITMMYYKFYL